MPDPLVKRDFFFQLRRRLTWATRSVKLSELNTECTVLVSTRAMARIPLRAESVASWRIEGLEVGGRLGATPYLLCLLCIYAAKEIAVPDSRTGPKKVDAEPRIFALASIATSCGFAAGPAIGGLLALGSDYSRVCILGIMGTLAATSLLFFSMGTSALRRAVAHLA